MTTNDSGILADQAIREADRGHTLIALVHLEKVLNERKSPLLISYFAYCLAQERKEYGKALSLCKEAIENALPEPALYLNLGRVFLAAGHKRQALNAFRRGLKYGRHPMLVAEMKRLGLRKPPIIPQLPRTNFLNRYLGLLRSRLATR